MKQIIIGKEGNQPFSINDEYVSRLHAIFTYDETSGVMTLTDRSANGTFIRIGTQFQQISQCNVDATTVVRLGPKFTFRVEQLFQKTAPPPPKRVDIAYLRKVAENYEETRISIEQKQAYVNSLRGLSIVGTLVSGGIPIIITKILKQDDWYLYAIGPVIAVVFLISLQTYCSKVSKDIITKKTNNDKSYKIHFCCPKCHVPFAGKLYENILAEGKCPKCKVEFYDSKL